MGKGWDIHIGPDWRIHVRHGSKHEGSVLHVQHGSIHVQHRPDKKAKQADKQSKQAEMVKPGLKTTFWDGMKLEERIYYLHDGRLQYLLHAKQGEKQGERQGDEQAEQGDKQAEQGDEQAEQAEQGCSAGLEWAGFIGI
jgi:hypothetical protein